MSDTICQKPVLDQTFQEFLSCSSKTFQDRLVTAWNEISRAGEIVTSDPSSATMYELAIFPVYFFAMIAPFFIVLILFHFIFYTMKDFDSDSADKGDPCPKGTAPNQRKIKVKDLIYPALLSFIVLFFSFNYFFSPTSNSIYIHALLFLSSFCVVVLWIAVPLSRHDAKIKANAGVLRNPR